MNHNKKYQNKTYQIKTYQWQNISGTKHIKMQNISASKHIKKINHISATARTYQNCDWFFICFVY